MTQTGTRTLAQRVKFHDARRHFERGGRVVVSEYGHRAELAVTPSTTTHSVRSITWDELAGQVRMWRGRYPNQRFYIIADEPISGDRP